MGNRGIPALFMMQWCLLPILIGCGGSEEYASRVLLVTLDTVRADAIGCYGFDTMRANTPNLDRFAAQGTIFRRATCEIPSTLPSHAAIMTGLLPRSSGVRCAVDSVPQEILTIAELSKEAGFSTAAFVSAAVLDPVFGLNQGFDVYDTIAGPAGDTGAERSAKETTNLALEWLKKQKPNEPIFLWVHYYDAHSPYRPPAEEDVLFPGVYDGPIDGSATQITQLIVRKGQGLNSRDLERLRSLYLAEVSLVDRHFGRLLEAFDSVQTKLTDLIVVVSDHGENLGEGGRFFHGADLYETSMHIPLLVRWPDRKHESTEVRELVMAMDVAPTILEACGLSIPEGCEGRPLTTGFQPRQEQTEERNRIGLLETEHAYLSDADKIFGAVILDAKLIDRRHYRRDPVLVGRALGTPLNKPCYLRAMFRGDPTARIVAHIRFHSAETVTSTDPAVMSNQPTILVGSSRFGAEPIHASYNSPEVPKGWTLQGTTDLYQRAKSYGDSLGWPTDHIVIESIAVDIPGVPGRQKAQTWVDEVALVGQDVTVIDNFDQSQPSDAYEDAGVGIQHIAAGRIETGQGVNGTPGLHIAAKFSADENAWAGTEFYSFNDPTFPVERENVLFAKNGSLSDEARRLAEPIDRWLRTPPARASVPATLDKEIAEKLGTLGYLGD